MSAQRVTLDDFNAIPSRVPGLEDAELAELLNAVRRFTRRYVSVTDAQAAAITLWVAHAHALAATSTTPYLHVTSAEAESGKSRLVEVLELVVPRPLPTAGSVTVAVMYRAIEKLSPTLLLDEADNVFKDRTAKAELLGIINSGYRRGQQALRMGGGNRDKLESFQTFCAKVIAGIDDLPPTLASRCLRIEMRRRRADEPVDDLYVDEAQEVAQPIREALAAWAEEAVDGLQLARPARLGVRDRLEEGLRLLLAIAAAAGPEWDERARASLLELANDSTAGAETAKALLLRDIRDVFDGRPELMTAELLLGLFKVETSPWADWWGENRREEFGDITVAPSRAAAMKLARMLKPFGIKPHDIGESTARRKGYRLGDFEDAFSRYLPAEVAQVAQTGQPSQKEADPGRAQDHRVRDHESSANPHEHKECATCATSGGGNGNGRLFPGDPGYAMQVDRAYTEGHITGDELVQLIRVDAYLSPLRPPAA